MADNFQIFESEPIDGIALEPQRLLIAREEIVAAVGKLVHLGPLRGKDEVLVVVGEHLVVAVAPCHGAHFERIGVDALRIVAPAARKAHRAGDADDAQSGCHQAAEDDILDRICHGSSPTSVSNAT